MMSCERFIDLIDDYLAEDGALDPALRHAADEHLGTCRRCQAELARTRALIRDAAALPRELTPERPLWTGIAGRLKPRAAGLPQHGVWQYALAATVVLAVGGMTALLFRGPASMPESPRELASAPSVEGGRATFVAHLAAGEGTAMTPETRAVVVQNLRVIERALHEIEAAVRRDPNDPNLRNLLITIHQQESALIDQSQWITVDTAKRNDI